MTTISYPNPNLETTVKIFDNFYNYELEVPVDQYDVVYSYFRTVTSSDQQARTFTTSLFRVADETQVDIMTLFQSIQDKNVIELSATLTYYLNGLRSPTSLLGISAVTVPNRYAAHNVRP